jgi:hypothetical protein
MLITLGEYERQWGTWLDCWNWGEIGQTGGRLGSGG